MTQSKSQDDWHQIEALDAATFAIGEPRYEQQNWSYLLLGAERALLFDTGSYFGDVATVAADLAQTPVTALPSHMHYDHLGGVARSDRIAVADLPVLRACADGDRITPTEVLFLGEHEDRTAPSFAVAEWLPIGSEIDFGGRSLRLIHTPGHSTDSVSLWEPAHNRVFAADFLYHGPLYAQTPGADIAEYLATARRLAEATNAETVFYGAHGDAGPGEKAVPPRLGAGALSRLIETLETLLDAPPELRGDETLTIEIDATMQIIVGAEALPNPGD